MRVRAHLSIIAILSPLACQTEPKPTLVIVEERKGDRPLVFVLADAASKARALDLSPYVMFSASWCVPCRTFAEHAAKDGPVRSALSGAYLLVLDHDAWESEARAIGVAGIPTWIALSPDGAPTKRRLDSSRWTDPKPEAIATEIAPFFSGR